MTEEIIITGEFDVQGINTKNFAKPLTYLKLIIGYPMMIRVDAMSSEKKEEKIEDWTCSICEKKYKTYVVILDDNPLSIALELEVRGKYYNQETKKGLCEECSKNRTGK
ncbi:MAG: hypothetical protein KKD44_27525 [Proteobacteria bacterium]|nr:hypothetical protein [Pseudomonadota bacterium]